MIKRLILALAIVCWATVASAQGMLLLAAPPLLPANSVIVHSGDSITAFGNGFNSNFANVTTSLLGYTVWADSFSKSELYLPPGGMTGIPGRTAVSICAGWAADVLKFKPKLVTLMAGTNDLGTVDNSATIITALSSCVSQTRAAGSKMVLIPILPRCCTSVLTPAAETGRQTANAWIATQAASDLVVSGIAGFDPATMTQGDGLHPSTVGASIIGQQVATAISAFTLPYDPLSLASSGLNLVGSPGLFTGTGGVDSSVTGPVATGWTQGDQTATNPVASQIANPNGGNWQQLAVNGTTSTGDTGTTLLFNAAVSIPAGSIVTTMFEVEVDTPQTNFMGFQTALTFTGNTSNNLFSAPLVYPPPNSNIRNFVVRTMPSLMFAPATAMNLKFQLIFLAGASVPIRATVRVGRMIVIIGAPFSSNATAIAVNSVIPAITGTTQVGQTLTCSNGTWSGSPTSFSYQWYGANFPIAGATNATYVPVSGDIGNTLTCLVYANNAGGSGSSFSAATAAITSSFTPANLPGLLAWYKADAGVYTDAGVTLATNGQAVQQWNDQSGNNRHLIQTTALNKPTYVTGNLNSLPVLTSAANGLMTVSSFALGGTTVSVFMVAKETVGNSARFVDFGVAGSDLTATAFIAAFAQTLTAASAYNNGVKSTGTIVSGSWNELGSIFDGANNTLYIAGAAQTPVAATPSFAAAGTLNIFSNPAGGNSVTGGIAEVIVCSGALGASDRTNIRNYLLAKWGL